jgi:hypothetical protein
MASGPKEAPRVPAPNSEELKINCMFFDIKNLLRGYGKDRANLAIFLRRNA